MMTTQASTPRIPRPSLRRLPVYLREVKALRRSGAEWVSCTTLAEAVERDATLVRKDISYTGITGKPKVGYHVPELAKALEHFIGWDNETDAFLAGVGNLGAALLGYSGFAGNGLNIVCGFDSDPAKIGTTVHGREILALTKLPNLALRMHVEIGIIAVPAGAAQAVAELMISGGIRALWNFAPAQVDVPEDVIVENEDLSASLAVLSRRLARLHDAE
jgi:redox-sensing transcriptional repressor